MTGREEPTVGPLPAPGDRDSRIPAVLTGLVWLLWVASVGVLAATLLGATVPAVTGVVVVDGLTAVAWVAITFVSGVVHSYARRYLDAVERFLWRAAGFTLVVMVLVAADNFLLFALAWLAMGLAMADLIGHAEGWPQARAAGRYARRRFLASSGAVALAAGTLWYRTGATTLSDVPAAVDDAAAPVVALVAGALLLAAALQSALVPFHTWLLSSMTAPTPASALMHAGFVNAGGILLVRFAPVVGADPWIGAAVALVGTASALGGKLLKTVQTDVKGQLGCSTVGQMGFMIVQVGLGFYAAAVTHLILHGLYKAHQFLGSGGRVAHESPAGGESGTLGVAGVAVVAATAVAGGALFAALTGKGTTVDGGLVLALLVVLTVLQAAREVVARPDLPTPVRYGAVPLVALPAIAVYAAVLGVVAEALAGLPAVGQSPELTVAHAIVGAAFLFAYLAVETGAHRRSDRLYVALLNAARPAASTKLTAREEYDER